MHTLIFKTNIQSEQALKELNKLLDNTPECIHWSIDTEDIDKALRVKSKTNNTTEIINTLNQAGYICEELPD